MVTADLLSRAQAGDGEAFRELTGPHRRELQVHCYRMLGSFADAEDAVQDTMLAAWQGIGGFTEERASLRTWLYKIATSRCLNARRAASRRPARERDVSQYEPLTPTPRDEAVWLQPFPDALLDGAADAPPGPEARSAPSPASRPACCRGSGCRGHSRAGSYRDPALYISGVSAHHIHCSGTRGRVKRAATSD
jgi:RNA polymerase sigma factor (sigma-70 family)